MHALNEQEIENMCVWKPRDRNLKGEQTSQLLTLADVISLTYYRELVNPHHARTLCVFTQNCLSDGVPYLFLWAGQFNVSVEREHS